MYIKIKVSSFQGHKHSVILTQRVSNQLIKSKNYNCDFSTKKKRKQCIIFLILCVLYILYEVNYLLIIVTLYKSDFRIKNFKNKWITDLDDFRVPLVKVPSSRYIIYFYYSSILNKCWRMISFNKNLTSSLLY
jgi:hypothetical protein